MSEERRKGMGVEMEVGDKMCVKKDVRGVGRCMRSEGCGAADEILVVFKL